MTAIPTATLSRVTSGSLLGNGAAQEAASRTARLSRALRAVLCGPLPARTHARGRPRPAGVLGAVAALAVMACAHASATWPPIPSQLSWRYVRRFSVDPRPVGRDIARLASDEFWDKNDTPDPVTRMAMESAALPGAIVTIACAKATSWKPWPPTPVALISKACVRALANDPRRMYRDIERRTFDYFWDTADPVTGLAPDHWPSRDPSSIAAVGFELTAYVIGADRGYVTRHAAAARVRKILAFLLSRPQGKGREGYAGYHGFFYHFIGMRSGLRYRNSELSTIDTALLMAGVLTAESYFDHPTATERSVRRLAKRLYLRVNWGWAAPGTDPRVSMAWYPDHGFSQARWSGYNEASILYILGLGSPTYPLRSNAWSAWTATDEHDWRELDGQTLLAFGPQFGPQYTAVWIDLRGIADPFMRAHGEDYFENSRRATLAQRQYAIVDPDGWAGYGPDIWGLTACNGPGNVRAPYHGRMRQFHGYFARGITNPADDDGTLAPTAVLGSLPFDPKIVTQATQALLRKYGDIIYTRYGFLDSFNPSFTHARLARHGFVIPGRGWVDNKFLGIDQGPIIAMIENQRTGLIWRIMRRNPYVRAGLRRAQFTGGWFSAAMSATARRHRARPQAAEPPMMNASTPARGRTRQHTGAAHGFTATRPTDPLDRPAAPGRPGPRRFRRLSRRAPGFPSSSPPASPARRRG